MKILMEGHLRVFGCTCCVHVQASHYDKLDVRAIKCVFMGYSLTQKGYQCFHHVPNKIIVSRKKAAHLREGELMCDLFPLPACIDHLVFWVMKPLTIMDKKKV